MKAKKVTSMMLAATLASGLIAGPVTASAVGPTFTDVPEASWAYPYIEQAAADGIVSGVGGGRFNPTGTVSYSEFGTMIARAFCEDELATYESEEHCLVDAVYAGDERRWPAGRDQSRRERRHRLR